MVPSGFHTALSSERGLESFTIRKEFSLPLGEPLVLSTDSR